MNHEEANDLLAALALDAVDDAERQAIEEHVATCPRCQSELDAMREVAGALGNTVEPLPEHLWSSISSRIYEDHLDAVPALALLSDDEPSSSKLRRSRSWQVRRSLAAPLAVAAVVVGVLAFQLVNADNRNSNLQSALEASTSSQVAAALKTPGHKLITLDSATKNDLATFVLLPDGRGYLVNAHMPTLVSTETYQLWGVIQGKAISIGLMGRTPHRVTFTVVGPPSLSQLAVTVEPSGGASTPTAPMVATGTV
jgi:anti-sigma-K factor RskA